MPLRRSNAPDQGNKFLRYLGLPLKPMLDYDEDRLLNRLAILDARARVAMAAACATRLLPGFEQYAATREKGDSAVLRQTLELIWRALMDKDSPPLETKLLEKMVMRQIPEDDDGWTPLDPHADNAGASTVYALRALESADPQEAAWAVRRAYDAVDYVATSELGIDFNEPGAEQKFLAHPLVQQELTRQERDLVELETTKPTAATFARLHERALAESAFELA